MLKQRKAASSSSSVGGDRWCAESSEEEKSEMGSSSSKYCVSSAVFMAGTKGGVMRWSLSQGMSLNQR